MPAVARPSPIYVASPRHPGAWDLFREAIREIVSRRRLIRYLVFAVMRKEEANTLLGNVWWILDPLLRLWFFMSPALYSTDRIDHLTARHPVVGYLFRLNPFTTLFEAYRDLIYRVRLPDPAALALLLITSFGLLTGRMHTA